MAEWQPRRAGCAGPYLYDGSQRRASFDSITTTRDGVITAEVAGPLGGGRHRRERAAVRPGATGLALGGATGNLTRGQARPH